MTPRAAGAGAGAAGRGWGLAGFPWWGKGGHALKAGGRESVVHGGGDGGGRWQLGPGVARAGRERAYGLGAG